jgi:hypothetical protein
MKNILLIAIFFLGFVHNSQAQIATFETIELDSTGFWNGADGAGNYTEEGFSFFNLYDDSWGSWSGFSISSVQDDTIGTWANQYGVNTGMAYSGDNFAVATNGASVSVDLKTLDGFYITNSTYATQSMLHGDAFAKQFGGVSGDDEDWYMLSVVGMVDTLATDTIEFYLADYRFADNSEDYIVNDWTWLDLSSLGNITSLQFSWSSSDNGDWGMNTPAYFCMDDLSVNTVGVEEVVSEDLSVYPNPVQNQIRVNIDGVLAIYDLSGKLVKSEIVVAGNAISVNELKNGTYIVKMGSLVQKIVKL